MQARTVSMLRGIAFVAMLGGAATPISALAQNPDRTLRIGILSSGTLDNRGALDQALVQGLREQGYVEGKNLFIERRYGSSKVVDNARELGGMKLDVVLTTCTPSTRVMKETSTSTPIVMAAVSDPVGQQIIASFAKPGGNVTGTSSQAEDLLAKRMEYVVAVIPGVSTVAILANARNPVHGLEWSQLQPIAAAMRLKLVRVELRADDPQTLPSGLESAVQAGATALLVLPDDPLMFNWRPQIVEAAAKQRLPDFHWAREFVESGGLMSYGESLSGSYRDAAVYIDKIKKGAVPASLPVAQPTRFEMVINTKAAKALGVSVPPSLLARADVVLQ